MIKISRKSCLHMARRVGAGEPVPKVSLVKILSGSFRGKVVNYRGLSDGHPVPNMGRVSAHDTMRMTIKRRTSMLSLRASTNPLRQMLRKLDFRDSNRR